MRNAFITKYFHKFKLGIINYPQRILNGRVGFRETQVLKSIGTGLFARAIMIIANFVGTALLVRNLGAKDGYGIYITITSIVAWLQLSNLGFGTALQNLLIDSVAKGNTGDQKKLIATTQLSLILMSLLCGLIWTILFLTHAVNWVAVVKGESYTYVDQVAKAVYISGVFTLFTILLGYVSPIYAANQRLHRYQLWLLISQIAGFIGLLIAVFTKQKLFGFVLLCQGAPLLVLGANAIYIALQKPKEYFPAIKNFSIPHFKILVSLGLSFSVIGLTGALQYGLDNIIVANIVGIDNVTVYSITQKVFNIFQAIVGLLYSPMWAAFGNAISCNHWEWVSQRFRQMKYFVMGSYLVFLLVVIIGGRLFIRILVGSDVKAPLLLIILIGGYWFAKVWVDIHSTIYNALNKIKTNAIFSLPGGLISAVSMYFGAKLWGLNGMVLGMALAMGLWGGLLFPYLVRKELKFRFNTYNSNITINT